MESQTRLWTSTKIYTFINTPNETGVIKWKNMDLYISGMTVNISDTM